MLESIDTMLKSSATWLWGPPMLIFLSLIGIYFTIMLRGMQFTRFFKSAKLTFFQKKSKGEGNISPIQALYSALGGVIGNGNLAGAATAVALGGPGSLFWMWIASFIGMIIVYAETLLAMKFRGKSSDGTYSGGPMYYILKTMNLKWLAVLFAIAMGMKTLMATSTIQSNSISLAVKSTLGIPSIYTTIVLAVLTWLVIIGGLKSIAKTLDKITPFMVIIYFIAAAGIMIENADLIGQTFSMVWQHAFNPADAAGGFAGASVMMALRYGVARGFYSNEAGTGSSPIMYSTAKTDNIVNQSYISMFGVFIDTIVGSVTIFLILLTGVWSSGETSTALTTQAFSTYYTNYGGYIVLFSSFLFGYSTLVAWCFYGEQCFAFVWGDKVKKLFRWLFCTAIIFGFVSVETLWSLGDLLNGLTITINLVAVIFLLKFVVKESFSSKDY